MSHYFIDKHDPRVADLFRRLEKAGKALDKLIVFLLLACNLCFPDHFGLLI